MIIDKEMAIRVRKNLISMIEFYELEIHKLQIKKANPSKIQKIFAPRYGDWIKNIQIRIDEMKVAISKIRELRNGFYITNDAFMYSGVSNEDLDKHLISNAVTKEVADNLSNKRKRK
jgi:hypothetical protein